MPVTEIVTESPHDCDITIYHGETWFDPLPQLIDPMSGNPFNLTGVTIELFCRPSFDHLTRFVRLTSVGSAGILIDDAPNGLASIFYSKANVEAFLPVSGNKGWRQFMVFSFTDPDLGPVKKEFWRGALVVRAARDTDTP